MEDVGTLMLVSSRQGLDAGRIGLAGRSAAGRLNAARERGERRWQPSRGGFGAASMVARRAIDRPATRWASEPGGTGGGGGRVLAGRGG